MGYTPHVLVVGGGPTAAALARDLGMRGLEVTLVARGSLAAGTTGLCSGLLSCGARLAATDPDAGARLHAESQILRDIASTAVEDTGGLLVTGTEHVGDEPVTEPGHDEGEDTPTIDAERIGSGCESVGIPVEVLDGDQAREREPSLGPTVTGAVAVPDAVLDPFVLTLATAASAREYGATIETHTAVTDVVVEDDAVRQVELRDRSSGETEQRRFDYVVDVADRGDRLADLAGVAVSLRYEVAPALVANERPIGATITGPQAGGRRVVPFGGRSLLAARTRTVEDLDSGRLDSDTVDGVLADLSVLVPALADTRALRGWRLVRTVPGAGAADAPPGFEYRVFDHEDRDGLWGLSTVVGGTLGTHRLVAEAAVDQVCGKFGVSRDCLTGAHPLPAVDDEDETPAGQRDSDPSPVVCACESVTSVDVETAIETAGGDPGLDAIRVRTRAGMGECQGGRCAHRLAAQHHPAQTVEAVDDALTRFFASRWHGQRHALWGDQLREAARTYALHTATLVRHVEPGDIDLDAFAGGDDTPPETRGRIP